MIKKLKQFEMERNCNGPMRNVPPSTRQQRLLRKKHKLT